jgi:hypothetical protein
MILEIEGVSSGLNVHRPVGINETLDLKDTIHLSFSVHPADNGKWTLKTGQTFENPRYARLHDRLDKCINASMFLQRADDDDYHETEIVVQHDKEYVLDHCVRYRNDELSIIYTLRRCDFDWLLENAMNGRYPSEIVLHLDQYGKVTYGWEPDGSHVLWDNENHDTIRIEGINFRFALQDCEEIEKDDDTSEDDSVFLLKEIVRLIRSYGVIGFVFMVCILAEFWFRH